MSSHEAIMARAVNSISVRFLSFGCHILSLIRDSLSDSIYLPVFHFPSCWEFSFFYISMCKKFGDYSSGCSVMCHFDLGVSRDTFESFTWLNPIYSLWQKNLLDFLLWGYVGELSYKSFIFFFFFHKPSLLPSKTLISELLKYISKNLASRLCPKEMIRTGLLLLTRFLVVYNI